MDQLPQIRIREKTALVNRVFTGVRDVAQWRCDQEEFLYLHSAGHRRAKGARSVVHTRLLASVPGESASCSYLDVDYFHLREGDNAMFVLRSTSTPVRHAWESRGTQM